MEFTYSAYENLIITMLNNGYIISLYENVEKYEKSIIIRHDIDFCPNKAMDIARIEYELGIQSTFFVLISTEFYNVFSKETTGILEKILKLGHSIGLHFDEQRYNIKEINQMKKCVYLECEILGKALSIPIKAISMHRPSKLTLDSNIVFEGLVNSYSQTFFTDMKYLSDSRMHWREDVLDIIKSNKHKRLHILTHPFWYSDAIESTRDKLLQFAFDSKMSRYKALKDNFRDLEEYIKEEDVK